MLVFKDIDITDKAAFEQCVSENNKLNSISDFGFFFLWNTKNNIKIAFEGKYCIIKGVWGGKTYFYCPSIACAADFEQVFHHINHYQNGKNFYIAGLGSDIAAQLNRLPDNCSLSEDRNASDYIYATGDLSTLHGKKLHPKRNFVNFFQKNYAYNFVEYDSSYYDDILALYDQWMAASEHQVDINEKIAIEKALKYHKELGLKIGLLITDNKIAAFSVCAISQFNVAQVFFEKGNTDYKGIYAMINYLTVNNFLADTQHINREEDMGLEGLRKAKLSYCPIMLYQKYLFECRYE